MPSCVGLVGGEFAVTFQPVTSAPARWKIQTATGKPLKKTAFIYLVENTPHFRIFSPLTPSNDIELESIV
ncbi:uncharacterized protein DFL_000726 [Arthrobotrys flagrans]|uniref:Uncharacterized protein n=1 Tax=Arthrobotrys flagrans TaxID=97331 RepID=A0A437AEJ9_ARTFL|nr:hypothetical protein DFL_000726 [Arthrobotrys flagrans]